MWQLFLRSEIGVKFKGTSRPSEKVSFKFIKHASILVRGKASIKALQFPHLFSDVINCSLLSRERIYLLSETSGCDSQDIFVSVVQLHSTK